MDVEDDNQLASLFIDQFPVSTIGDDLMNMNLPFLRQQEEDGSLFHNVLSAQGILPIGMDIQNESAGSIDNERNPLNQPDMMETSSSRLNDAGVSYSELIGIPSKLATLLTVIVISPEESTWMQQLCEGVELYLANRYIFCRISVYNKKEYAIALQSTACDLCIVYKEQLETVSVSFPSMYCAEYSCTDINNDKSYNKTFMHIVNVITEFCRYNQLHQAAEFSTSKVFNLSSVLFPTLAKV